MFEKFLASTICVVLAGSTAVTAVLIAVYLILVSLGAFLFSQNFSYIFSNTWMAWAGIIFLFVSDWSCYCFGEMKGPISSILYFFAKDE